MDDLELVPEEEKIPFKTIPLEEFTKLENIVVIDVRTASEFEDSRIKNSWNVKYFIIGTCHGYYESFKRG